MGMRKVEVMPYDPHWQRQFGQAAMEIKGIFIDGYIAGKAELVTWIEKRAMEES